MYTRQQHDFTGLQYNVYTQFAYVQQVYKRNVYTYVYKYINVNTYLAFVITVHIPNISVMLKS